MKRKRLIDIRIEEVNNMELHWDAAADLEDLIYECKEVSASER